MHPTASPTPRRERPSQMRSAVFSPVADEGRAERVERRLADAITSGVLRPDERLPSESELARTFRVAPVTVREALEALRGRGLIVTRRGRSGGSFVTDLADPDKFATRRLVEMSRAALRDLAAHYLVVATGCVRLAAQRADPSEVDRLRHRLAEIEDAANRTAVDDFLIETAALSHSARLTRELMRLQAEFAPLLALADADTELVRDRWTALRAVLDAIEDGDEAAAATALADHAARRVDWLVDRHHELTVREPEL